MCISEILFSDNNYFCNFVFYSPYSGYVKFINVAKLPYSKLEIIECTNQENKRFIFDNDGNLLDQLSLKIIGDLKLCFCLNDGSISDNWDNIDYYKENNLLLNLNYNEYNESDEFDDDNDTYRPVDINKLN